MQRGCVGGSVRPRAISEKCKYRGKRLMRATRECGPLFRAIKQFPRTHGIMSPLFSIRLDIEQEGERTRVNAGWEKERQIEREGESKGTADKRVVKQEETRIGKARRTAARTGEQAEMETLSIRSLLPYVCTYVHMRARARVRTNTIRYRHRSITSSLFKATLISLQPERLFILDAPVSLPIRDHERYFSFFL